MDLNAVSSVDSMNDVGSRFFGEMVNQQARWLGVPVINSGASGCVQTQMPKARVLLGILSLLTPRLFKLLPKAEELQMTCDMISSCKVVDAGGSIVAQCLPVDGEGLPFQKQLWRIQNPRPPKINLSLRSPV